VHAPTTDIQAHASSIDTGIAHIRDEVMPSLAARDGFVDRDSGQMGADVVDVGEFELAIAHLRVLGLV
jgi:hypothetical protein